MCGMQGFHGRPKSLRNPEAYPRSLRLGGFELSASKQLGLTV